jgi:DNA-binding XRE family transcriptional regulator
MKLFEYLSKYGIKHNHFASRLGISKSSFSFLVTGEREPKLKLAIKIVDLTDGEVTLEDLLVQDKPNKTDNKKPPKKTKKNKVQ